MKKLTLLCALICACSSKPHDTTVDAAIARKLVVTFGQSNAGSKGLVSELTGSDVSLAYPLPSVLFSGVVGNEATSSTTLITYPIGPLAPQTDYKGTAGTFGVELSMMHELDAAQPGAWSTVKYSIGSTSLVGSWPPVSAYRPIPTVPLDLYEDEVAFTQDAIDAEQATVAAFVWIQGEEDAAGRYISQGAINYGANLAKFIAAQRVSMNAPAAPFFVGRLNVHLVGAGVADVRAGEEANASSSVVVVDQDPYPLGIDGVHYSTAGIVELGRAYAQAILASEAP
jgi:hypothetical protein